MALGCWINANTGQGASIRFGSIIAHRPVAVPGLIVATLIVLATGLLAFTSTPAQAVEPPTLSRDDPARSADPVKRARALLDAAARRWMRKGDLAADADLDGAIYAYRHARRLAPKDFWATVELMHLLRRSGDIRRAARVSRIAIKNATDDWRLSVALSYSGQYAQELGKLDEAREKLTRVVILRTGLLAKSGSSDKGRDEAALDLAEAHSDVCNADLAARAFSQAIESCRHAIAILQPRVDRDTTNPDPDAIASDIRARRRKLAFTYMHLGDALLANGHVAAARDAFERDVRLSRSLAAEAGSASITAQRDLSISLERMGDLLAVQGRIEDAIARYVDSHRIAETLATSHPHDDALRNDLSITQRRLSELQAELKKRGG